MTKEESDRKEGNIYAQSYQRGKTDDDVKVVGKCGEEEHGTKVVFMPDDTIFETTVFEYDVLKKRLRETAFLTKGVRIVLTDDREEEPRTNEFYYEGGIKEFVTYLNKSKTALYENVMYFEGNKNNLNLSIMRKGN